METADENLGKTQFLASIQAWIVQPPIQSPHLNNVRAQPRLMNDFVSMW